MKVYNGNKIIKLPPSITTQDGTLYTNKLTEEQLNSYGYYYVEYQSQPNRRYYISTQTSELIGNKWTIGYTSVPIDLEQLKTRMISDVKKVQKEKLDKTDWLFTRALRQGTNVVQEVQEESDYIYTKSAELEAQINTFTMIEECILFEATPQEVEVEDETAEQIDGKYPLVTITKYINNTLDW